MSERDGLIQLLLGIIGDYREGQIPRPDFQHVNRWIEQFPKEKELAILKEVIHILSKTYFPKKKIEAIFNGLTEHKKLAADNPALHWTNASLLDIQKGGNSQHEFTALLSRIIKQKYGIDVKINSNNASCYYYVDDVLCSGSRIQQDLESWIKNEAPNNSKLVICIIALHRYGHWATTNKLAEFIKQSGKTIEIQWLRGIEPEDRKRYTDKSDVLRPTSPPQDMLVQSYIANMKYQPTYRTPGSLGELSIFSSEEGRNLLEQEFLIKGVHIRSTCIHLKIPHRPLGFSILETLGFGSMVVTYRNCPNNAPLALWVGDPWYPLLPRSTNKEAMVRRAFEAL